MSNVETVKCNTLHCAEFTRSSAIVDDDAIYALTAYIVSCGVQGTTIFQIVNRFNIGILTYLPEIMRRPGFISEKTILENGKSRWIHAFRGVPEHF